MSGHLPAEPRSHGRTHHLFKSHSREHGHIFELVEDDDIRGEGGFAWTLGSNSWRGERERRVTSPRSHACMAAVLGSAAPAAGTGTLTGLNSAPITLPRVASSAKIKECWVVLSLLFSHFSTIRSSEPSKGAWPCTRPVSAGERWVGVDPRF